MARYGSPKQTPEEYRERLVMRCEIIAKSHEAAAAKAHTESARTRLLAKAAAERRNAEIHRQKLADLNAWSRV